MTPESTPADVLESGLGRRDFVRVALAVTAGTALITGATASSAAAGPTHRPATKTHLGIPAARL